MLVSICMTIFKGQIAEDELPVYYKYVVFDSYIYKCHFTAHFKLYMVAIIHLVFMYYLINDYLSHPSGILIYSQSCCLSSICLYKVCT